LQPGAAATSASAHASVFAIVMSFLLSRHRASSMRAETRARSRAASEGARGTRAASASGMPASKHDVLSRTDPADALELLARQHVEIDALFEQIASDGGDKAKLFEELADKLAAHAMIEEKVFYPSVMAKDTADLLRGAVEDHLEIKRALVELLELSIDDEEFDDLLDELAETIGHHVHEEEAELFTLVRAQLSEEELVELGDELLAMYEELMADTPRRHVLEDTFATAPLPPA
jgi:hypothetical protein